MIKLDRATFKESMKTKRRSVAEEIERDRYFGQKKVEPSRSGKKSLSDSLDPEIFSSRPQKK